MRLKWLTSGHEPEMAKAVISRSEPPGVDGRREDQENRHLSRAMRSALLTSNNGAGDKRSALLTSNSGAGDKRSVLLTNNNGAGGRRSEVSS